MIERRAVARAALRFGAWAFWPVMLTTAAWGQAPPATGAPAPSSPATAPAGEPGQVDDLAARYRFVERYTSELARGTGGEIGQYQVAIRDVIRVVTEKPQGAPDRSETTVQIIFSERPAAVNGSGMVTDMVRRYEALRLTAPAGKDRPSPPKVLEGLTMWFRPKASGPPLVMALTPDHGLTETEYSINAKVIFLPDLATALPSTPVRVGDQWRIPRSGASALLGDRPASGQPLVGTLQNVRKVEDRYEATIGITGRATMPPNNADMVVNARLTFQFAPPATPAPAAVRGDSPAPAASDGGRKVQDAVGMISEVRLARSSTSAMQARGGTGRLRSVLTWELTLQRKAGVQGEELAIPKTPPTPTEANSWLTYDDPTGRFHFRHPQELQVDRSIPSTDGSVNLVELAPNGFSDRVMTLQMQEKTGDAADRSSLDPETHFKELKQDWAEKKQEVIQGPRGWLPEAEWSPFKMKVYRIEAAFKLERTASKDAQRLFFDYYLVEFTQNESMVVTGMTALDPPTASRKDVEASIKTIQLGPSPKPKG